jgi:hypothetical protein
MNVDVPNYNGRLVCKLQVDDGSTVAFGAFTLHRSVVAQRPSAADDRYRL